MGLAAYRNESLHLWTVLHYYKAIRKRALQRAVTVSMHKYLDLTTYPVGQQMQQWLATPTELKLATPPWAA